MKNKVTGVGKKLFLWTTCYWNRCLSHFGNEKIGFVFQFQYLFNEFTLLENVMTPSLKMARLSRAEIEQRVMEKLRIFGMQAHAHK